MNASETPPPANVHDELAAAMDWWREAGVDCDFSDDVTAWLQLPVMDGAIEGAPADSEAATPSPTSPLLERAPPAAPRSEAITPRVDFFAQSKPATLEEFREFWMSAPGLDAIGPRGRVPPRGEAGAEIMVLVVDPEERDQDTLLSGPQGRLLERIIAAMGTQADKVYVASALPRHTPMADTAALAAGGLDSVLEHHIGLVAPKRILAFGAQLTPFIAEQTPPAQSPLRTINYKAALPPVLASEGLDALMETPPLKSRFWRRWMAWSADK